jgi:hypothetical protein
MISSEKKSFEEYKAEFGISYDNRLIKGRRGAVIRECMHWNKNTTDKAFMEILNKANEKLKEMYNG